MNKNRHAPITDESLKALMELMPVAAGWLDLDGTCRYVNSSFVKIFGYTLDDLTSVEEWFAKAYPDSGYRATVIAWYAEHITSLKSGSTPPALKVSITCKNGSIKHVLINSRVTHDRIIGIYTDITESEIAQQRLHDSEEMFRISFEEAKDAIFWANVETGILVHCNRAAEDMLEMPRNRIIGRHQSLLHPPEMHDHFVNQFKKTAAEADSVHEAEAIVITGGGKRIPVQIKHSVTRIGDIEVMQGIFRDISEQKLVEKTLTDSRLLLQKTLDSLFESVFIVETGTRAILNVNKAVETMFGYTCKELIGRSTACLHVNEEMSQRFASEMLKSYDEVGFYETAFRMKKKDGTEFESEHYVTPFRDEKGQIIQHVCVVRDISKQVRAMEAQRKIALEQRIILDNSCVGITMTKDRHIIWTNNRFNEMFGYEQGELQGQNVRILYSSDEAFERSGVTTYETVAKGLQYESELQLVRKDGSTFWARYYGKAINPDNLSNGTIWIIEDISSRKAMELAIAEKTTLLKELNSSLEQRVNQNVEALIKKEQILLQQARLLVDLAPEAIIVVDIGLGTIIDANVHAEKLFECSKYELYSTSPLSFYKSQQPDGLPPSESYFLNTSKVLDGEILVIERAIVTRKGRECICEIRLVSMPSDDRSLIRASIIDITERKRIEAELTRTLKTARRDLEEQKQFIGLISHELRTPLAIIDGAAQLLILTACQDSACLSHAERIRAASKRITDLVDTCLTEERIASSGWEPEILVERIHQLIHDVVDKIQTGTSKHRIELDLSTLPSHCSCDATLVRILLVNLLENAIKYSPHGGIITVRGWNGEQGEVRLQVSDQGIGFAPELSEKIFERYFRTWQVQGIAGAGLGLYLVKRIAEIHGGGVAAESQLGQGATFTVWIRSDT